MLLTARDLAFNSLLSSRLMRVTTWKRNTIPGSCSPSWATLHRDRVRFTVDNVFYDTRELAQALKQVFIIANLGRHTFHSNSVQVSFYLAKRSVTRLCHGKLSVRQYVCLSVRRQQGSCLLLVANFGQGAE